jgi:hypothetical protein
VTVLRILVSLALPRAFGLRPGLAVMSTRAAAGALGAGLAFAAAGAMIGGAPRAVSGLAVTVAAIGGGVALGRALGLKPRVMAILLAPWSIAGIAPNALISGGGCPGRIGRCRARLAGLCRAPDSGSGGPLRHGATGLAAVHRRR